MAIQLLTIHVHLSPRTFTYFQHNKLVHVRDQLLFCLISIIYMPLFLMERRTSALSSTLHNSLILFLLYNILDASPSSADLAFGFYSASCPSAEFIVRSTVRSASSTDSTIPGKLLRLLFHDCFVEVTTRTCSTI